MSRDRDRYVLYAMLAPIEHINWMSTRTKRMVSVPEFFAWVPLIEKRRNEGTRPERNMMNVRRSPRKLRMRPKAVSWKRPLRIPHTAMQTPISVGSRPSPPT